MIACPLHLSVRLAVATALVLAFPLTPLAAQSKLDRNVEIGRAHV